MHFSQIRDFFYERGWKREIKELYLSLGILRLAIAMVAVFEPIYLFNVFGSIPWLLFYLGLLFLALFFIYPLGGKFVCRFGFEHSFAFSIPAVFLYFVVINLLAKSLWFLAPLFVLSIIYKILFWPATHSNLAHYGDQQKRGHQYGLFSGVIRATRIVGPLLGGLVLYFFSFKVLFVVAATISFLAIFPMFSTKEEFASGFFPYKKCFLRIRDAYRPYKRKFFLSFLGFGEEIVSIMLWPLFIFLVVRNYASLGGIVSISSLFALFFSLYIGKMVDKRDKRGKKTILSFGTALYALLWPIRAFLTTVWGVFGANVISANLTQVVYNPLVAFAYQKGDERGHLKYIIFLMMGIAAGKALMCFLLLLLILVFGLNWYLIFGVAGLWTLLYLFL